MHAWTLSIFVITTWSKDIVLDQKTKVLETTCDETVHFHANFVRKVVSLLGFLFHLSVCLPVCLYICVNDSLPVYCLSFCLSVCFSVCFSVCLSVCLSVYLFIGHSFFLFQYQSYLIVTLLAYLLLYILFLPQHEKAAT